MTPSTVPGFDYAPRTRIVFAPGALDRLGELVREYGGQRTLLVSDAGIVRAGHVERAECSLQAAGIEVVRFDRVCENPTTRVIDDCVEVARAAGIDFLVGLGGGSSMDAAKGCNFLLTNGGRMEDYWGVGKASRRMLPFIAVPTTAGTGSECQSFALVAQAETHVKMACGDPKAAARVALLDPQLTLTQPRAVAVTTGMDALSHALESAVTTRRNPVSQMFARTALARLVRGLPQVLRQPQDLEARGSVLLGAALAGMAIENSMLGAAHAAANPLTARYGVIHGQAVGLMLPGVIRYNAHVPEIAALYQQLAVEAGLIDERRDLHAGAAALAGFLEEYRRRAGLPTSLEKWEIEESHLNALAEEAARQWTGSFNPRPVAAGDFVELYRAVLEGSAGDGAEDAWSERVCRER